MFDWNDVRHFLAVARTGSTLGAARELGVNQTTCARRIEALEAAVGQRLFDRTQTGRALTEAGLQLLPCAEEMEKAARQFGDAAASHNRGLSGSIRLTTNEVLANVWLTPALADFRLRYPQIGVELITADRFFDLTRGEADIAIRATGRPNDPGCVIRKLISVPWAIYCSQAYVERRGMPTGVGDLNNHVLVGGIAELENFPSLQWLYEQAPRAEIHTRSNSLMNLYYSVKAGLGVGPLPITMGDPELTLVRCTDDIPDLEAAAWLIVPERLRDVPRVRAFMDFVVDYMAAIKVGGQPARP
jgi:DNA-binding transcriptional LysR family regulator